MRPPVVFMWRPVFVSVARTRDDPRWLFRLKVVAIVAGILGVLLAAVGVTVGVLTYLRSVPKTGTTSPLYGTATQASIRRPGDHYSHHPVAPSRLHPRAQHPSHPAPSRSRLVVGPSAPARHDLLERPAASFCLTGDRPCLASHGYVYPQQENAMSNPEETLRKWLDGMSSRQIGLQIGSEYVTGSIFAVRADYIELDAVFNAKNYAQQKTKRIRVPLGAISWATDVP